MTKDIATLLLALLLCQLLLLSHLTIVRDTVLGRRPEVRLLLLVSLAMAVGDLLLALRTQLSGPFWLVISNVVVAGGVRLLAVATRQLLRGQGADRGDLQSMLLGAAVLSLLVLLSAPYAWIVTWVSLWLAQPMLCIALLVWRQGRGRERALSMVLLGGLFALGGGLGRALEAHLGPERADSLLQPASVLTTWLFLVMTFGALAAQIGLLMASFERTALQLEQMATTDGLTGCLNRSAAHALVGHEIERSRRDSRPLALVLLDLDHFKQVNDRHGHAAGDAVLRGFAQVVRSRLRHSDIFGRMGGEEFCVVLPATDRAGAHEVVDALRHAVERAAVAQTERGETLRVTVSAGTVIFDPTVERLTPSPDQLFARADMLLYRAKHAGRNQVQTSGWVSLNPL
ncbi:hypothetical protein X805_02420 [Sphaerotilus natans subsp. natans DSM 6575]|uniref:diguanylate cyclase n=1 Tax=Sphaerotilus natans subsp. natans DSM 6575 TaxID=1286631 RepID=A0A059KS24_9BURK|nr:GGDEF domain-containing protein [Sphaerotilus natans]KDB54160.1 hypothetical protein X805_02420 [Sphaerotilus natans subsp. natans DSM 6575]SIR14498.1 diguanylate cyclase (GGDEF) domain-containing protein [Sphaerotilus natans]